MAEISKIEISCAIFQCDKRGPSSDFVNFPKNQAQKNTWKQLCGLTDITSYSRVCKGHFRSSDFGPSRIRPNRYPSQNLPVSLDLEIVNKLTSHSSSLIFHF